MLASVAWARWLSGARVARLGYVLLGMILVLLMGQRWIDEDAAGRPTRWTSKPTYPLPIQVIGAAESLVLVGTGDTSCTDGAGVALDTITAKMCCVVNESITAGEFGLVGYTEGTGKHIPGGGGGECISVTSNCNEVECAGKGAAVEFSYSAYGTPP